MRDPRQYFTLTRGSTADKAILYVRDNGAKDGFIPNQRLWIALPGGDILLRRLVAVETANVGELALHLSSELGVTVPPASRVGRDYFARLDTDCVAIRHESAGVSRCELSFYTGGKLMRTVLPQIVELYEIIADTIHTLTTSREPVLWRGAEWTPAAVERGELRGSVDGKAATVTLTACMDTLLTRYLASLPILPTRVNIYEHEPESGDTVQVFGGVVLEVIPGADATQVSVNCLSSSCILDAMLPRMIYSGQCQFVLFDSGCGLAAQSWGVTASVSVDGYLLASPSFAAYPNGYFTRGYAAAGGDFRFIVAHGGDTITLQLPFDSRVGNGGTVTAYPGCDGSPATCRDRFGNSARFGGCASIPSRNPAVWGFK